MTATRSLCLSLELTANGERIAGRLADQHGSDVCRDMITNQPPPFPHDRQISVGVAPPRGGQV